MRRLLVRATLAAVLWAGFGVTTPAQADVTSGHCSTDTGVTLVVDHGPLGGGIIVRCVEDVPAGTSGLQLLSLAGFTPTGTIHDGPGFLCRIDDRPSANETLIVGGREYREACVATPPRNAFWSYWHASNGGQWTFASYGGGNREVIPGGYEGWSFSLNNTDETNPPPGVTPSHEVIAPAPPPAATTAAPPPPPATTKAPAPAPTTARPATTAAAPKPTTGATSAAPNTPASTAEAAPPPASTTPAASPSPTPAAEPSPTAPSPEATGELSPSPEPTTSETPPPATSVAQPPTEATVEAQPANDMPIGTIVGIGSVAVLGSAGGVVWWRRRVLE